MALIGAFINLNFLTIDMGLNSQRVNLNIGSVYVVLGFIGFDLVLFLLDFGLFPLDTRLLSLRTLDLVLFCFVSS